MIYPRWLAALLLRIRPAIIGHWLKRLLCWRRQEVRISEGVFWVDLASNFGLRVTSAEGYEPQTKALLLSFLRPGLTFLDLGANEGYFSVVAAKTVGPEGRVISIEPQARLGEVIRRNFTANGATTATLHAVAISDMSGSAEFNLAPDTNSGSSGLVRATRYANPTQQIRLLRLEEFLGELGVARIDVMKVDIEGFEYEAILGSPKVFQEHRIRCLVVEVHGAYLIHRGRRPEDIADFMLACGYARRQLAGYDVFTL